MGVECKKMRSRPGRESLLARQPNLFLELMEAETASLAAGVEAAVHAQPVQLLQAAAVDLQHLEERGDVPDVEEGNLAELSAPLHGDADGVEEGENHVVEVLAAVEACEGAFPHAGDGVGTLGLGEDILEGDLQMVVDVVWVTVDHVELSARDCCNGISHGCCWC